MLEAIQAGARTLGEAFAACGRMEERIFMGDSTFFAIAGDLARPKHPLLTLKGAVAESLSSAAVALTAFGREVSAGREDHVLLNGIDKWLGGVHLTTERCYRWSGDSLVLTPS
jgi:hypothetical protein